jgi:type VI secretion system protein ImpA
VGESVLNEVADSQITTLVRVIDECIFAPIPGDKPAGEDPRLISVWGDLKKKRPSADDGSDPGALRPEDSMDASWPTYRDEVESALCTKSKDLELGLFLAEACTRIHGFVGVRDGCWAIRGLITNFKDKGLFPEAVGGDFGIQWAKLNAINTKLAEAIRQIPLTMRSGSGANYDLNYHAEARRPNGMITPAEFDAAASAGTQEQYSDLLARIAEAKTEIDELKSAIFESYGPNASSLSTLSDTVAQFKTAVLIILRKRGQLPPGIESPSISTEQGPGTGDSGADSLGGGPQSPTPLESGDRDSWAQCEELFRKGDISSALAIMTKLAASEPNGRVRFHRKLVLADLCLQTNRKQLGTSILEELNEIIDYHKLDGWENSEVVGGVWSRLVRCYRDKSAGTANEGKEADFYLKLSRLDPWKALACGEPERKRE